MSSRAKDEFPITFGRIPTRNSSLSCSSRFYYRSSEGVPFEWEMQPGTPKNPPLKEGIPPLSPPPAILSLGLPRPFMEHSKPQSRQRLMGLWRKYYSKLRERKKMKKYFVDKLDQRFGFCSSDEFPCKSSFSSTSSSSSSSLSFDLPSPPPAGAFRVSSDNHLQGCGPWNINAIKVAIGRRV